MIHKGKQCGKHEKPEDFPSKGRRFFSVLKFHKSLAYLGEACLNTDVVFYALEFCGIKNDKLSILPNLRVRQDGGKEG